MKKREVKNKPKVLFTNTLGEEFCYGAKWCYVEKWCNHIHRAVAGFSESTVKIAKASDSITEVMTYKSAKKYVKNHPLK